MNELDLQQDVAVLTEQIMNIESVSGNERQIADQVHQALLKLEHLQVHRDQDAIVARTNFGRERRVVLAGHLDTVPLPRTEGAKGTVPAQVIDGVLYGRGATDMKGGVAVQLALAAELTDAKYDVTYVFYDHEEVEAAKSGLGRLAKNNPELLEADFAILLEPTNGTVEGGCNGTSRFVIRTRGKAAHSGRSWMGHNAIHDAAPILQRLADYQPQTITVEGLDYREGMNAVRINGVSPATSFPIIAKSKSITVLPRTRLWLRLKHWSSSSSTDSRSSAPMAPKEPSRDWIRKSPLT